MKRCAGRCGLSLQCARAGMGEGWGAGVPGLPANSEKEKERWQVCLWDGMGW